MKNFIRRAAAIAVNAALAAGMLTAAVSVNAAGAAAPVPGNAIFVNECLANSKASTQTVTVDENGATRTAAYSTENGQEPENKLDMLSLLESGSVTLYDSTDLTDKPRTDEETMEQAKNIFDGDVSTCSDFRLDGGKGSFLVIDLGKNCEISLDSAAVTARNDQYYTRIKGFKIQGANEVDDPLAHDGWTDLTSEAESAKGEQALTVTDNGGYRYLRLYNANEWFGNIGELRLYGTYTKHEYDIAENGYIRLGRDGFTASDSPTGPFVWKWYGKPVYDGYTTYNSQIDQAFRDMNLFVDDDGEAYVIYSSEANRVPYIVRLNDDYTWIDTDGMNTVTEEDFKNGTAKYDENGVYTTGTLYGYSSDGTGYVNESGGAYTPTEEDLKTLTYVDTTTAGINGNIETSGKYNYYLPSFNRYQLICGNRILIRQGTTVDRADGLEYIPLTEGEYGRWAKIGQYGSGLSNYREAPAIIKKDGVYYMIASGISGWKANTGIYLRTTDLFGEWETCTNPFVGEGQTNYGSSYSYSMGLWDTAFYPNAGKSFLSQSTCIFEYGGNYYYMGDRWKDGDYWDDGHLGVKKSTYVWLPITFTDNGGGTEDISIEWTDEFEITLPQDPEPEP